MARAPFGNIGSTPKTIGSKHVATCRIDHFEGDPRTTNGSDMWVHVWILPFAGSCGPFSGLTLGDLRFVFYLLYFSADTQHHELPTNDPYI